MKLLQILSLLVFNVFTACLQSKQLQCSSMTKKKVLLWRQHCPWMSAQTCLSGRCQRQPICQAKAESSADLTIKAWTGCNLKNSPLGLATAITFLLKIRESCRAKKKKCHFADCVFSSWGCERSRVLEGAPVGRKTICLYSRVSAVRADLGASLKCVSPQLSEQSGVHWASRVKRLCAHILSGYCGSHYSTKGIEYSDNVTPSTCSAFALSYIGTILGQHYINGKDRRGLILSG